MLGAAVPEVPVPEESEQPVGGEKRMVRVQLLPLAKVFPEQLSDVMLKGEASGLAEATLPITRFPSAVFVTVTTWSAVLPSRKFPKGTRRSSMGATESVTLMSPTEAAEPMPFNETVTDALLGSLLGMLKLSVKVPVNVGANATVMVQEAAGAMVWPEHVSFVMVKGAASESVEPTAPITRAAFPVFVIVTVCVAELPAETVPYGTSKSFVGETESVTAILGTGTVPPVPLTFTVTVLLAESLLGILKLSDKVTVEVGANAIVRVQVAAGTMV